MWSHQHTNMLYYNPILKITFDATSTSSYCPISLFRVEQNYSRVVSTSSILFKKYFICLFFREKGQEEERGEKHQSVYKRYIISCLSHHPTLQLGSWPETSDFSIRRLALNTLSHTSQGLLFLFKPIPIQLSSTTSLKHFLLR